MRAVYLISWAIITALICYVLYEHSEESQAIVTEQAVSASADQIQVIDATSGSAYVDDKGSESDSEMAENVNYADGADSDQNEKASSETDDVEVEEEQAEQDEVPSNSGATETQENASESSDAPQQTNRQNIPEQVDFLQKAHIEFNQNAMTLPKMEHLEKYLDSIAQVVVPSDLLIVLEGHADKSKSRLYDNFEVGKKRADFIKNALLSRGVPEDRIQVITRGDTMPRVNNDTAQPKKNNRRVELFLKQNKG